MKIALIGCGKMGHAMLDGWLNSKIKASYIVVEPSGVKIRHKNVTVLKKPSREIKNCDVIVLAVKPQVMADICKSLRPYIAKDALILSIAAGRSIKGFEKIFGGKQPIIRTMPNLPASIGKGMTVAVPNKNVKPSQEKLAARLLETSGKVQWLKAEKTINSATAINGNGPAYVFLLIEMLAKAGTKAGLKPELAMTLARQTVIGGAALAESSKLDAATLRKNVTSPGGTTEAALKIMMDGDMQKIVDRAIAAGKKRSEELSS